MPSAELLKQKEQYVKELTEKLKGSAAGVLVDYKGITVADDTKLRKEFREAGVQYTVVKNTMLRFAAKEAFGKALGTGIRNFELKEVEVKKDSLGKPFLQVSGAAKKLCETVGVEKIHLSISHEKEYAVAFIVLETA